MKVFEHATRWAIVMFEKGTLDLEEWGGEG
jgi:hypothetical protein